MSDTEDAPRASLPTALTEPQLAQALKKQVMLAAQPLLEAVKECNDNGFHVHFDGIVSGALGRLRIAGFRLEKHF